MSGTLPQGAFDTIANLLKARSGLAIGRDKLYLLDTRLAPILKRHELRDLTALAERLRMPRMDVLAQEVVEAMTTNESLFFRDDKPFEHVRTQALPRLHAARPPGTPLRIWSAASSSGQEAYSLAMTLTDMRATLGDRRVEIIGTDIAREQLARAREGLYSQFEVQRGLPIQSLLKNFTQEGNQWRVSDRLRRMVSFRTFNLLDDFGWLGEIDLVFCRNVLLYFDGPSRTMIFAKLADILTPDGTLVLGATESADAFVAVSDAPRGFFVRPRGAATRATVLAG